MPNRFSSIFETHAVAARYVTAQAEAQGMRLTKDEALAKSANLEAIHNWPEVKNRVEEALRPRPEPEAAPQAEGDANGQV